MATISVTIANADVPRALAAFTQIANAAQVGPPVVVDQAWIAAHLKDYIRKVVRQYERDTAVSQAQSQAEASLPPDIT